ncbi:18153_t:CDS:1, partial [Gigaspora margarita]
IQEHGLKKLKIIIHLKISKIYKTYENTQDDQGDKVHEDTQYNYRGEDIQDNISNSTHDYIFEENIVASNENSEEEQEWNNNDNIYKTENEDIQEMILH